MRCQTAAAVVAVVVVVVVVEYSRYCNCLRQVPPSAKALQTRPVQVSVVANERHLSPTGGLEKDSRVEEGGGGPELPN